MSTIREVALLWLLYVTSALLCEILAYRGSVDPSKSPRDIAGLLNSDHFGRRSIMKRRSEVHCSDLEGQKKRLQSKRDVEGSTDAPSDDKLPTDVKYYFKDRFRIVLPYDHVYESFTKGRWFGKTLYEVLCSEFAAFTDDYAKSACANGLMKVYDSRGNDLYPTPGEEILDHICSPNEKIWHLAVVHEQLALDKNIRLLYEDEDYIAVSKPCSIPLYHTGTYHFNTVVEILKREVLKDPKRQLFPVHRLDKLTSGVIILAKNRKAASEFGTALRSNRFRKVYLARVSGDFNSVFDENKCIQVDGKQVVCCHGYMRVVSHKLSVHEFLLEATQDSAKPAETRFRMISYNPELDESLIMCYPVTGRTHQIRAHLKFLGFPISNDICYNDGKLSESKEYFPDLPVVHWELDEEGRWRMPELDFVSPEPVKLLQGSRDYHIGLNKLMEGQKRSPSGIFLHALRYIWLDRFNVSDLVPEWTKDFYIPPEEGDLSQLNLWLEGEI